VTSTSRRMRSSHGPRWQFIRSLVYRRSLVSRAEATAGLEQRHGLLTSLPTELLVHIVALAHSVEDICRLDCVSSAFHCGPSHTLQEMDEPSVVEQTHCDPTNEPSVVEMALRIRARAYSSLIPDQLPAGVVSWAQLLLRVERLDADKWSFHDGFLRLASRLPELSTANYPRLWASLWARHVAFALATGQLRPLAH